MADEAAARAVVESSRQRHWNARHHCSAFILGPDGRVARSSDDGEPAGTAGSPMLDALRGAGVSDTVAVVTRWFGGTLLGTGGLIRAYSEAVRAAVAAAGVQHRRLLQRVCVPVDLSEVGRVENEVRARGLIVVEVTYTATGAHLTLDLTSRQVTNLPGVLGAAVGHAPVFHVLGEGWADAPTPVAEMDR